MLDRNRKKTIAAVLFDPFNPVDVLIIIYRTPAFHLSLYTHNTAAYNSCNNTLSTAYINCRYICTQTDARILIYNKSSNCIRRILCISSDFSTITRKSRQFEFLFPIENSSLINQLDISNNTLIHISERIFIPLQLQVIVTRLYLCIVPTVMHRMYICDIHIRTIFKCTANSQFTSTEKWCHDYTLAKNRYNRYISTYEIF